MPKVNHEILSWARRSAGLTLEEGSAKLDLKAKGRISAADRLLAYENGTEWPPRQLLAKMSKQYRRPLLAFYMSSPPRKGNRGEDYRTVPEQQAATSILVDALIRDVRARQDMVRSLLDDAGEVKQVQFIGSATSAQDVPT